MNNYIFYFIKQTHRRFFLFNEIYILDSCNFSSKFTSAKFCCSNRDDVISAVNKTELPLQRLLHMWTSPSRLRIGRAPRKKTQP